MSFEMYDVNCVMQDVCYLSLLSKFVYRSWFMDILSIFRMSNYDPSHSITKSLYLKITNQYLKSHIQRQKKHSVKKCG
jgi:hypothetical protein